MRLPLAPALTLMIACAAGLSPAGAQAQLFQRETPQSRQEVTLSFAPVVKKVAPAVVNVYGAQRVQLARHPLFDDPFFREFFGGGGGAPRERMQQSVGSGVLVTADGLVLTNYHVIEGMTELKVALSDKREFEAEILLRDPKTDLAVLRLKAKEKFPALEIGNSDDLQVGDLVLAVGNPFGVGQTVTQGIVSALARTQVGVADYQFFVQTDAAINPGNSGGALVDMQGRLVGINSAIYSKSGGSHGIGFAIPANMARVVLESAVAGGKQVRRPWFGAKMQNVTSDMTESLGLDRPVGALISSVVPGSPAADAGVKAGDVITAVDGALIDDPDAFGFRFATKHVGGNSTVSVLRSGKKLAIPVKLAAAPETKPRDVTKIGGRTPFTGLTVMTLSPAVAEEVSLPHDSEGVVVGEVEANSPAQEFGFQKGDILLSLNGTKLNSGKELDVLLKNRGYSWRISLKRGDQVFNSVIGG